MWAALVKYVNVVRLKSDSSYTNQMKIRNQMKIVKQTFGDY